MVGIFTGAGSGLERGSARQLGASGLLGSAAFGRSSEQLFLNAATGNLLIGGSDEFLVGRGPDAAIGRAYNSLGNATDENADNWRQSTDRVIFGETGTRGASGATVKRRSADGSEIVYTCNGSGVYVATDGDGAYDTLTYASGTWSWTDGDTHTVETYEVSYGSAAQWRLKQVTDNSGIAMTLSYVPSSDHLDKVTTADGDYIQYSWSGNNITQVVTHYTDLPTSAAKTMTRVAYAYDGLNRLTSVTTDLTPENTSDAVVYTATYTYDGGSTRVASITESDGTSIAIVYDPTSHKVTSITQTVASGVTRVTSIAYTSTTLTTITDPLNQVTTLEYNADGSLKKITAPPSVTGATPQTMQFLYDGSGNVLTVTDPTGAVTTYGGYFNGNWTTQTDPLLNVVTRAYDANNNMTSETRIGDDNTANAASHTTLYAYDSHNRLVGVVSPRGVATAYEYDSNGLLTRTMTDTVRNFFTLNAPTSLVTGTQFYNWLYGLSTKSTWSVVANGYDARGNLLSTTTYSTTDVAGNGLTTAGYTVDTYLEDQAGRLISRSKAGLNTEHFVYDGLGRMKMSTDVNGGTTNIVFTDSMVDNSTTTMITTAAGYVRTATYNRAGDLISLYETGTGIANATTNYEYDALGRVRVTTDANTNKTYTLYDHAGRKTADIDSYGFVREYRYDDDNRLVATVRWTNAISGGNLTTLATPANTLDIGGIRPTADAADIWSWTVYDANGNTVQTIEGDGSVTSYQYDGSNQLVRTLVYGNKLTSAQLTTLRANPVTLPLTPTASSSDSFSRTAYNTDGVYQATLDFAGYIHRNQYDNAERMIGSYVQTVKPDPSIAGTSPISTLTNSVTSGGVSETAHYIYDLQNRLRYVVDGLNHITEYDYDDGVTALDTPRRTIRYAGTIDSMSFYTFPAVPDAIAAAGLAANPDNRIDYTVYDGAGRAAFAIDADGAVTGYGYDTSGRLIKTVAYATLRSTSSLPTLLTMTSWATANATSNDRVNRTYYTSRGEVAYTIDGEGYVVGNGYDPKGQLINTNRWDTPVSATDAWTMASVTTAVSGTPVTTAYTYDADGRVLTMRDGEGHGHDYVYAGNGMLAWDIRMSGSSTDESKIKYVYDAAGRLTDRYDGWVSGSASTHYVYDGLGHQISVTDPNGKTLTRTFDGNGRVLTETDPLGGVTTYQYEALGNVAKFTDACGNSSYTYFDAAGRVVATRDAENYVTTTTYTAFDQVATVTRHSARATNAASTTLPAWTWDSTDVPVTTTYEYDKLGQMTKVTDPLTNYSQFTYNAFGEQSVIRDARGMLTSEAYDRRGLLKTQVADTAGTAITTSYTYDARGQVLTATDANGKTTTSTYDLAGRLKTVKDPLNNTTTYTYDGRDNLVAVTDALLNVTRSIYDANDRKVAAIDALGGVTTYAYDADGHLISQLEYKNRVSTGSMGAQVAMSTLTPLLTTSADDRITRYAYDDDGRLRYTVDAKLHVVALEYDAAGNVLRSTAYDGAIAGTSFTTSGIASQLTSLTGTPRITRSVYDALGRLTFSIDPLNHVTWLVRDAMGNVIKQVDYEPSFSALVLTHGTAGNPTIAQMIDWQGWADGTSIANRKRISRAWYDSDGRLTYSLDTLGFVTRTEYDAGGNVTKTTRYTETYSASDTTVAADLTTFYTTPSAPQVTQYTYDTAGRLTDTIDGEGNKIRVTLSQKGQVLTSTTAADTTYPQVTTYTYDDDGRVLTETVQTGTGPDLVTSYTYNAVGSRVKVHDARGNDTYLYYDALGQQIAVRDAESYVTETAYSTFGDVTGVTRHSPRATNTPATGTLPTWTWGSFTDVPATTNFEYNTLGQLTRMVDATLAEEDYALGNFGERLSVTNKLGGITTYTYDLRGLVLTETLPHTITTKDWGGTTIYVVNRYEYDSYGNRTKMAEADGAAEMRTTVYTYDKNDQLLTTVGDTVTVLSNTLVESDYIPIQTLTYDSRGNIIKSVDADAQTFFYYDRNDRLVAQISPVGTLSTFAYDAAGNKTSEKMFGTAVSLPGTPGGTPPTGTGTVRETRYAYDRANRLVSTTIPNLQTGEYVGGAWAFTTGNIGTALEYDAAGNVTREVDARGNSIYHWYDALGREVARIDQENYLTVWARDAEGNTTKETRYANKVTSAFTSATASTALSGLLGSGATDANRITDFTYDKNGRRLTETRESVDYVAVDSAGAVTTGNTVSTVAYTYDGLGHVLIKAEANGDTIHYDYDAIGRLTRETGQAFTDYLGNTATAPRTAYTYDGLNDLTSTRVQFDATGTSTSDRVTTYAYGAGGRLLGMTDANDNERIRLGTLTAGSLTHRYGYDKAGRTVRDAYDRLTYAALVTEATVTLYDIAGRAITQTYARLDSTTSSWLFSTDSGGTDHYDAVRISYDAFGDVVGHGRTGGAAGPGDPPVYQEQFFYDNGGRLWKSNSGDGVWRLHVYDAAGNETLVLASTGADLSALTGLDATKIDTTGDYSLSTTGAVTTVTVYDKRGQVIATREPDREVGGATATVTRAKTYNAFGEVLSETDGRGYTTSFAYNSMGRMLSKTSPQVSVTAANGGVSTVNPIEYYGYDISGRLDWVKDANLNVTRRALLAGTGHGDTDAMVTKEFHADTGVFETKYDVFGDVRILRNELYNGSNATVSDETRGYDMLSQLITVGHRGGALTDHYVYDILGQRSAHWNSQFGSGAVETTDYDTESRVTRTVDFASQAMIYTYAWDSTIATGGMATGANAYGGWIKYTVNIPDTVFAHWVSSTDKQDYFGRTVDTLDFGSHDYDYTFDLAGRLVSRTNNVGESIGYSYYNSGLMAGQTGTAGTATYQYDANGNRTAETFASAGTTYRTASATYDALGRMTHWEDRAAAMGGSGTATDPITTNWEYDAVGNVRAEFATFRTMDSTGAFSSLSSQSNWYLYDSMNHVTLTQGSLSGTRGSGTIVASGGARSITYNVDGTRHSVTYTSGRLWNGYIVLERNRGPVRYSNTPVNDTQYTSSIASNIPYQATTVETYTYGADGQLTYVDIAAQPGVPASSGLTILGSGTPVTVGSTTITRDALGRISYYKEVGDGTTYYERTAIVYDMANRETSETSYSNRSDGLFRTDLTNVYIGAQLSSDARRNYKNGTDSAAADTSDSYSYQWWDGALQAGITYDSDTGTSSNALWYTTYNYDASGHIVQTHILDGQPRNANFITDQNGMVVDRLEAKLSGNTTSAGNPREDHYLFAGQQFGQIGNNGTDNVNFITSIATRLKAPSTGTPGPFAGAAAAATPFIDFDQNYDAINGSSIGSTASSYTIQGGETLGMIAQQLWGDSSLWYLIADANGLTGAETLGAGTTLIIPNKVINGRNAADTFRPYNPNEAMGDTSPTAAKAPPKGNKCGTFGLIMMVVIAVAVTIVSSGAAVAALSSSVGSIGAGIGSVLGLAGATSVGAGTLIAAGVVGGVVGSIASQAFGIAIGAQTSINWKGVAIAGITGAIQGGLSSLGRLTAAGNLIGGKFGSAVARFFSQPWIGGAARGILSNAATQGIARVTGLQKDFDFLGVAMAGLSGAVSQGVGGLIGAGDNIGEKLGSGLVSGMAGGIAEAASRSVIQGTDFGDNLMAELPNVIGNTIGSLIGDRLAKGHETMSQRHARLGWIDVADNGDFGTYSDAQPAPTPTGDKGDDDGAIVVTARRSTYKVAQNQSVSEIARIFHVDYRRIMELNGITDATKVRAGTVLVMPDYVVRPGDSAASIARRTGADPSMIYGWNGSVRDGSLSPGDRLAVHGIGTPHVTSGRYRITAPAVHRSSRAAAPQQRQAPQPHQRTWDEYWASYGPWSRNLVQQGRQAIGGFFGGGGGPTQTGPRQTGPAAAGNAPRAPGRRARGSTGSAWSPDRPNAYNAPDSLAYAGANDEQVDQIYDILRLREGYRNDVYPDSKHLPTVGIGHLVLRRDGLSLGDVISDDRVSSLFVQDSSASVRAAQEQMREAGIDNPDFLAPLTSVNMQLGTNWTTKFAPTWRLIANGNYEAAARRIGPMPWATQTPVRVADFQAALRSLPPRH